MLLNVIYHQPDTDKIFVYTKDPYGPRYQLLIRKSGELIFYILKMQSLSLNTFRICKVSMTELRSTIQRKHNHEILIAFAGMIADIISNNFFYLIVNEIFIRVRKLKFSSIFISQSYCKRLNTAHFFIINIPNR